MMTSGIICQRFSVAPRGRHVASLIDIAVCHTKEIESLSDVCCKCVLAEPHMLCHPSPRLMIIELCARNQASCSRETLHGTRFVETHTDAKDGVPRIASSPK